MVKTTLVERDFVDGEILLRELDLSHMKVHSAMWLYDSEVDYWKRGRENRPCGMFPST